jgi:hypothetical protein
MKTSCEKCGCEIALPNDRSAQCDQCKKHLCYACAGGWNEYGMCRECREACPDCSQCRYKNLESGWCELRGEYTHFDQLCTGYEIAEDMDAVQYAPVREQMDLFGGAK